MSMISSLIDKLNKSADEWNGSNMFELARMCREAADTIWELRDDLQRANAAVQDAEHVNELEASYHKAQAEAWQRRARQLRGDNLMLHDKVEMLHRHLAWYRHKVTALKEETERLRD